MFSLGLVLLICSTVWSESVRETETWMPVKPTQTAAMLTHRDAVEASGSDFRFTDEENEGRRYAVLPYDDEDEYDEFSGSGDGATTLSPRGGSRTSAKPDINDNKIPGAGHPARPTVDEEEIVRNSNEIPLLRNDPGEEQLTNVLMSHASDNSIFNKTGVLAALITGCAVSLIFAVFLILLLIHRMKKKDEGSYDLGKKPIYKKAPTTEIYA